MKCIHCEAETSVVNSRPQASNAIRRQRKCQNGHSFYTWESTRNPVARNEQQRKAEERYRERRRLRETPEERTARHKAERLRKQARAEAKQTGQPLEQILSKWGLQ